MASDSSFMKRDASWPALSVGLEAKADGVGAFVDDESGLIIAFSHGASCNELGRLRVKQSAFHH